MKTEKDWQHLAALERAVKEKYGEEVVKNPKRDWTPEKETKHLEETKRAMKKKSSDSQKDEKVEKNGYIVNKKLFNKKSDRQCPVCQEYSFEIQDGFYMTKFECCHKCYIQYVDQREARWKTGWRPNR